MHKSLFGGQSWQGPLRGFRALGAGPGICSATALEPIPSQIMSARAPVPDESSTPPKTLDTLTPTLVVGTIGILALAGLGVLKF